MVYPSIHRIDAHRHTNIKLFSIWMLKIEKLNDASGSWCGRLLWFCDNIDCIPEYLFAHEITGGRIQICVGSIIAFDVTVQIGSVQCQRYHHNHLKLVNRCHLILLQTRETWMWITHQPFEIESQQSDHEQESPYDWCNSQSQPEYSSFLCVDTTLLQWNVQPKTNKIKQHTQHNSPIACTRTPSPFNNTRHPTTISMN